MIKCCIFDLDGTLVNTLPTIQLHLNTVLGRHGLMKIDKAECQANVGSGAWELLSLTLNNRGITDKDTVGEMLREYLDEYNAMPMLLTEAYEGVPELTLALKRKGIKLAVLSNKPHKNVVSVAEHCYGDVFDVIQGDNGNIELKPSPRGAVKILDSLGVSASECAFIGDSDIDMLTARNLGCGLSIGVLWGFRAESVLREAGADRIVSSAYDIESEVMNI